MAHLVVKKVGPIEEVDIYLNKVNVIMGPQSSGKSTLNKIACFCSWVEKKVSLDQSFDFFLKNDNFLKNLTIFHKLKGYLKENSEIEYTSSVIYFQYKNGDLPYFEWKNQYGYKRTKISYIPAERNVISMISDWKQVSLPNNNILNFMSDWNIARKNYTSEAHSQIKYLDIEYYYNTEQDIDYVHLDNGVDIELGNASSGQQSMIPLYILVEYFTKFIYESESLISVRDKEQYGHLISELLFKVAHDYAGYEKEEFQTPEGLQRLFSMMLPESSDSQGVKMNKSFNQFLQCYINTNYSSLYIEEPELSLFPLTQCSLLYHILNAIQSAYRDHKLFITTHSPYILYALNNCMMAWLVREKMPEEEMKELACYGSFIDPALVSVWEIKDGKLRSVSENGTIQEEDGLVNRNYFDEIMKEVMGDFYKMLNYYGNDQEEA